MKKVFRGLTYPLGFRIATGHIPIKRKGPDILLLVSEKALPYSAVFTTNRLRASCVERGVWQMEKNNGYLNALLVNSGNANAVTGQKGEADTQTLCEKVAQVLDVDPVFVLMCSTGIIGERLPVEKMKKTIETLKDNLSVEDPNSDRSILTTDTRVKSYSVCFFINGQEVRLSAIAKGSGMIHPNMATMLAFVTTDCAIERALLDEIFRFCVEKSFHAITVDGDQSTNDTALIVSSCLAKNPKIVERDSSEAQIFQSHLLDIMRSLARDIVLDGEGATKLIEITVKGARSDSDAKSVCMAVANSSLVKTAMFGEDPNWGRIMAALGASGVVFDLKQVQLFLQDQKVFSSGEICLEDKEFLREMMKRKTIFIDLFLDQDLGEFTVWTSDLSHDYVHINSKYHT